LSDLSRDLGVAVNTIKAWLSVLEATFQVMPLRPYFANVGKRLVKTPKIYFTDVGTLCHLAGLRDPQHAAAGPMAGAIFETAVLSEIVRTLVHRGIEPQIHFWRTAAGSEVDFVIEQNQRLIPVEVKVSATPRPRMAAGISAFRTDLGRPALSGYVIHPGDVRLPLGPDAIALPFRGL
jgi:predicted AAA+ superfamily ATPase